jgi:hypothetical protein
VHTLALGLLSVFGSGCDEGQSLEATIDAKPGIQQVGSADGPLLDEDEACQALYDALVDAKDSNGCDDVVVAECPDLVRPGGSLACVRYAEESVDECVSRVEGYGSCKDFVRDACVIVAVVNETSEGCVPPGPNGDDAGADDDAGLADDDAADDDAADDDAADDDDPADDDPGAADDDISEDGGSGDGVDASTVGDSGPEMGPEAGTTPIDSGTDSGSADAEDASR